VLWFVAEAEGVPVQAMMVYLSEEKLMESVLYKSIFEKGEARGRAEGRVEGRVEGRAEGRVEGRTEGRLEVLSSMLVRTLTHRLGALDPATRERIRAVTDADTLQAWCDEVTIDADVETARRLVATIAKP
jgi:predicted transposase YdaD